MGQVHKQSILLGSNRAVGTASVDGGSIRAEGGPIRPQLIVPLTLELHARPADAMIAVTWLGATLSTDQNGSAYGAICQPVSLHPSSGFHINSIPDGSTDRLIELRFHLSPMEVELIEQRRQVAPTDGLELYLGVDISVAAVRVLNSLEAGKPAQSFPWGTEYGLYSQVLPFWNSQVHPVRVEIEQSKWSRDVLPGLGYDRLRVMELVFPPALPDHPSAARQFDQARRALDERRYGDSILACRGLLNMWEKQLGATRKNPVADVIAGLRTWPAGDVRHGLLDSLWKEVGDIANAPHHPEGDVDAEVFDAHDARLVLLLAAALSQYVSG